LTEPKQWVKEDPDREDVFWPTQEMKDKAWVSDESIYEEALDNPKEFWANTRKKELTGTKNGTRRTPKTV